MLEKLPLISYVQPIFDKYNSWTNINIIQSECRSPDISGVYDPIPAKFCKQVGLWTKVAEKYPNFGYLDNRCHGNQKTSLELIKHVNGYGGGSLDGKEIVAMTLCYHGNRYVFMATKKCTIGQSGRTKCVMKMSQCRHRWPGWRLVAHNNDCDVTLALTDVMVQEIDVRVL